MKEKLFCQIQQLSQEMTELADRICDHPEPGLSEFQASGWICQYLERYGFKTEKGAGGFETAFRAEYTIGDGNGPGIGLLCEYDALEGIGHGCGHHIQGPGIAGAAVALSRTLDGRLPCRIIVYGTPAEETLGAKIPMMKNGCFRDLDLALMIHASGSGSSVDNKTLAMSQFDVVFTGIGAHAAISPEKGRSALDAMLLSFHGMEILREHVPDDIRMHYCIPEAVRPVNVVHDRAVGSYALRGYSREVLNGVIGRFYKIIEGAALMTETEFDIQKVNEFDNGIAVPSLQDLLMKNAYLIQAPDIRPPREKAGSTDFGSVSHYIPGACMRIACGCEGIRGHSKELAALGKLEDFHKGMTDAAKILAASVWDYLNDKELQEKIKFEFEEKKGK